MPQNSRTRLAFTILTLFVSICLSLLLGEWVFRYFYHFPRPLVSSSAFGNKLPEAHFHLKQKEFEIDLKYNAQGFRDNDFEEDLEADIRFLFLGDSFIEGFGVEEHQRASNQVEDALQKKYPDWSIAVFNAGQIVSGPFHYFKNLVKFGISLKPDGVIVGLFMGNDFIDGSRHPVPNGYKVTTTFPKTTSLHNDRPFWQLPFLYELMRLVFNKEPALERRIRTDRLWEYLYQQNIDKEFYLKNSGMDREAFEQHLKKVPVSVQNDFFSGRINPSYLSSSFQSHINSVDPPYSGDDIRTVFDMIYEMYFICNQRNIPFLIILFPSPYQVFPEAYRTHLKQNLGYQNIPASLKELDSIHQSLVDWLSAEGINTLDLKPLLRQEDYFIFDGHLNIKGQSRVATDILKKIEPWVELKISHR